MKLMSVVGARPNFVKLAPICRALATRTDVVHWVVHTGQHYDYRLSQVFFEELGIAEPDINLEVGSGTQAVQTARLMERIEPVLVSQRPDVLIVYGDVNSTVAASLVAAKLAIPIAHVEAGLRSRDLSMPEEINRIVTDRLASILFAPSRDAVDNLLSEGLPSENIHFVGNVMIDTLVHVLPRARTYTANVKRHLNGRYALATLHRPSNVDEPDRLHQLIGSLSALSTDMPVVFPTHPRTRARLERVRIPSHLHIIDPVPYIEMLSLLLDAAVVVTDSGGVQEEASFVGVPCITVRPNTERPVTVTHGTNQLVDDPARIRDAAIAAVQRQPHYRPQIELWDGHAAERIVAVLVR